MASRVSFSGQEKSLTEIAEHYESLVAAVREYYSSASCSYQDRFGLRAKVEVDTELSKHLDEIDLNIAFNIMSATEAALRLDYLNRAYQKRRDNLSRELREVYKLKAESASLEDDILAAWTATGTMPTRLAGDLRGAIKYRHWIAHGRYWEPKLGRRYDYFTVFNIADSIFDVLDQHTI